MALLKHGSIFTILFAATILVAVREVNNDLSGLERRLLPQLQINNWVTCNRVCHSQSDCSDGWFCKTCLKYSTLSFNMCG
ncbi:hypothetical protein R3W88_031141 [Solanum pinnatisectum]|uniref:Carboxypeptidase A inhibitor-like domain-containing protein n=1 Tax=Solanum pinnatisectum TaxID=50273 RepID=A0AAV9LMC0_9SOLN|nr:hypothetical protein R3W88_031141 [Solanum pinnatisectum]